MSLKTVTLKRKKSGKFLQKNHLKPFKKVFKFLYICIENDNEYFSLIINEEIKLVKITLRE